MIVYVKEVSFNRGWCKQLEFIVGLGLKRKFLKRAFVYSLCIVALVLSAQVTAVGNLSDNELLRGSRLVFDQQPSEQEYRVVLSSIKKVNNRWRAERQKLIKGILSRETYVLDKLMSYRDAKRYLLKILEDTEQQLLFRCDGLDCGSSNGWANAFLDIKQLYGLDSYQYYAVLSGSSGYTVFYLVQRGNDRIYLQVDKIVPQNNTSANMQRVSEALESKGFWIVQSPDGLYDPIADGRPEEHLEELKNWLVEEGRRQVMVVGHARMRSDPKRADTISLEFANKVGRKLMEMGVKPQQLTVTGIGGKAPRAGVASDRVEIVLVAQ